MPIRPTKKTIREAHRGLVCRTKELGRMSESELENEVARIYSGARVTDGTAIEYFALLMEDALRLALEGFYDL